MQVSGDESSSRRMKDSLFSFARNIIPSPSSSSPESNQELYEDHHHHMAKDHHQADMMDFSQAPYDDNFDISEHLNMDMFANSPPLSPTTGDHEAATHGIKVESPGEDYTLNRAQQVSPVSSFPPDSASSSDWSSDDFKYQMKVGPVPPKSRVETQIRLTLNLYPPPPEGYVHLPADTISKPKLQLKKPFDPNENTLMLETYAVCESNPKSTVSMCRGCIKRERKRAFRKKVCLPAEEEHWSEDKQKNVVVFNCKELVELSNPVEIEVDGNTVKSKQANLPIRLACYCRHHQEKLGYR
ncbi:hypothetical protein TRICI_005016 [Trichomonascus ciferrii]|uniref:SPT23/MGA2-like DNA-binding domain-containing protein n=1 Tax=Trichomonascus ciferrii TaxID=44093 RepID=A0A642UXJ2_9ASCO|nr:hypothetical protein TRICI_005016 [Trichomonascus ciferrii]